MDIQKCFSFLSPKHLKSHQQHNTPVEGQSFFPNLKIYWKDNTKRELKINCLIFPLVFSGISPFSYLAFQFILETLTSLSLVSWTCFLSFWFFNFFFTPTALPLLPYSHIHSYLFFTVCFRDRYKNITTDYFHHVNCSLVMPFCISQWNKGTGSSLSMCDRKGRIPLAATWTDVSMCAKYHLWRNIKAKITSCKGRQCRVLK